MTEVILNDECMHCNNRECHNGEHFCNQAMKDNSFYKNAKLYKGLEVIQRPTYEELEKENAELKNERNAFKIYSDGAELDAINLNEQLAKAKELIKELMSFSVQLCDCRHTVDFEKTREEVEKFMKE